MPNLFNNPYANLASKGRFGDTMLAHINPQEAGLLSSMGGAGTINPQTGLREFYQIGKREETYQAPFGTYDMRGASPARPEPFDRRFADTGGSGGMGVTKISGYTLPTDDKKFADIPLDVKYDAQGNFRFYTLKAGNYLTPDPSRPNIQSVPRLNANGEVVDWGIVDVNEQDNGSFGSMVRELATEFAPMILAGLAAYGGSLLSGFGGAAGGVTGAAATQALGPYAAQAAGAYSGSTAAAAAAAAGNLTGITNATVGQNLLTQAAGNQTGLTFGQAVTPPPTTTTTTTPPPAGSGSPLSGVKPPPLASAATNTAATTVTPSILQSIADATKIPVDTLKTFAPSVIQGLLGLTGSVLTADKATDAAKTQADAITKAAQIAADAAKFRPVGVTTRFGTSNFTTDAAGNVVTAGYTPSAEITGYQDRLKTLAGQGMTDVEAARAAYQPLTGAAQNLFSLGQSYLAKTPEQAAQDYITKQQALLAPSQENRLAMLQNQLQQQGRGGLSVAQGGNLGATTPEMQAYYNSLAQQDLVLAAQADQEARNRIQFGSGLFDTGANLQGRYYTGQTAAYSPFTTAMDTSAGLESLAQVPLTLSTQIGAQTTASAANAGQLTSQGIINAAGTMAPANAYSVGGNLFSGAANSPVLASALNKAFGATTDQATINQQIIDILLNRKQPLVA